jgi:hypothetical protein
VENVDLVDIDVNWKYYIMPHDLKAIVIQEMSYVVAASRKVVIHRGNVTLVRKRSFGWART